MSNLLEQLKAMTTVVADTGEFAAIECYTPEDATTNPSLILKAVQQEQYRPLLDQTRTWVERQNLSQTSALNLMADKLAVSFGEQILKVIPGRISTEVDARLSFDTQATIERARGLIRLYEEAGIGKERVLIKIASTWEGIQAARQLETEGINCNLTLLFGFAQAVACAEAGVYLISPFVGRILDWYKKDTGRDSYPAAEDPGVLSVSKIFNYYKQHGYNTVVMGASFRNSGEIIELAGCDRLTISPQLLDELASTEGHIERKLDPAKTGAEQTKLSLNEAQFRWMMNEDAMATEKLAEGIRNFTADQIKLEQLLQS
ncbi:transaldolase [Motiliproteus sp.]|uniref:transaldolase n=1 Tax=Motiliproteus sp. TaxID=1898955 RepID=UPI003BA9F86E